MTMLNFRSPKSVTLQEVAERLQNKRVDAVVAGYREYRVCLKRTILLAVILLWALFWSRGAIQEPPHGWQHLPLDQVLPIEAVNVLPWLLGFFVVSSIWTVLVRSGRLGQREWVDAAGSVANLVGIGVMLSLAWNLTLATITLLPLASIIIGARFGRTAFYLSMAFAVLIVGISAPENYWVRRPAFGIFALVLLVGLPLTVNRLLAALWTVSEQAVLARDAQNRFISSMSHELRTPLNAVVNCSQLIETEHMAADQRELMKAVSVNATALRHRVNEVLDVASIDGGRLHLQTKPLNMLDVLHTVQAVCTNAASSKGITLSFRFDSPQTPYIVGDEGRIEQVITNLVTNAIKFTPAGGVVELLIAAESVNGKWAMTVTVTDTGVGIPDEKKESIFAPFTQISTGSSRTEGGVGLGLFIALSVSDIMHGKLSVADNPGGGSIFQWRFTADIAPADSSRVIDLREAIKAHQQSVPAMHCLVFEDMDTNRFVIGNLLSRAGHRVTFYPDGNDASARIRTAAPDIVFLDLHMPGKSGWGVLSDIADFIATMPPIYVLTADTRSDSIREAMAVGIAGYLAKPINAHELLETIKSHADVLKQHN